MNTEEIKKDFFYYCCDCNLMCRDKKVDKDKVLSVINLHKNEWINEFQSIIENKIYKSNNESEICLLYAKYVVSCDSYDELYHLAEIIYKMISTNTSPYNELFIYFYDIVFYTKSVSTKVYFKTNQVLIEYYKITNIERYKALIKMTNDVLSKDVVRYERYEKIKEMIKAN